jgi:CDP-glucose 4,6-dehydratase
MVANKINKSFWKKKRVLITGHSGFKGSWLSLWLKNLSAEVHGISLAPKKDEISLFNLINLKKKFKRYVRI